LDAARRRVTSARKDSGRRSMAARLKKEYALVIPGKDELQRPYGIIRKVASMVPKDAIITTEVGQY